MAWIPSVARCHRVELPSGREVTRTHTDRLSMCGARLLEEREREARDGVTARYSASAINDEYRDSNDRAR
jgi:hypothetical protein